LIDKAMDIADYVLIWDWRDPDLDRGSEHGEQSWVSAVRASRVTAVSNCHFGAYLLSRADPRGVQRAAAIEQLFEKVFRDNLNIDDESVSGPGSCLAQTAEIRRSLPYLLQSLGAKSLLDAACGDFNWMKHVALGLDEYVGADIVSDLVADNQRKYGGRGRRFIKADIMRDELPVADIILCRDFLVHLSYEDIRRAVQNFKLSAATYLLATTFPRLQANSDIVTGQWRPLNLQLAPFHFPRPIRIVFEGCTEAGGRYADKSSGGVAAGRYCMTPVEGSSHGGNNETSWQSKPNCASEPTRPPDRHPTRAGSSLNWSFSDAPRPSKSCASRLEHGHSLYLGVTVRYGMHGLVAQLAGGLAIDEERPEAVVHETIAILVSNLH
jgi:hypothetical protein